MGFIDKLKGRHRRQGGADAPLSTLEDESYAGPYTVSGQEADDLRDTVQDSTLGTTISVAEGSIISEAAPSSLQIPFHEPQRRSAPSATARRALGARVRLPLIGGWPSERQQRFLGVLLALGGLGLVLASVMAVRSAGGSSAQIGATGQALMQSQRLAKAVLQALAAQPQAFAEVRESTAVLATSVRGLQSGQPDSGLQAVSLTTRSLVEPLLSVVDRAEKNASTVLAQEQLLTQVGAALKAINRQSGELLDAAEAVAAAKVQQDALPTEVSAAGRLVMLTQRIGKSANESLTVEGVSPEALFLLGKDLN
nr:type IV pili methyl-accepting chemotaxis transducer N-terminal domain-containing protein [Sphaerotilus sp.]